MNTGFSACDALPPAPAYRVSLDKKTCVALGDLRVAAVNPNPSGGGININYFHGSLYSNSLSYSSRIYLECNSTENASTPLFEHEKEFAQSHFKIFTKYACPVSMQ